MRAGSTFPILALTAVLTAATLARAEEALEPVCYDALVSAVIVSQIPSERPDCEGCHTIFWPWIVDLQVERVLKGGVPDGPAMTVLAMQHTRRQITARPDRWWLRRNSVGNFNVVRLKEGETPQPCPAGAQPAKSYIQPLAGLSWKARRRQIELAARRDGRP